MSYAEYAIAIAGQKSVVKSLLNIQTPTISNVLIVSLKLASLIQLFLQHT